MFAFDSVKLLISWWFLILIIFTSFTKQTSSLGTQNCEIFCPESYNERICSGFGKCDCSTGNCHCFPEAIGTSCQFRKNKMTCGNLRNCVQCNVYGTGPFADGCKEFCMGFPQSLIVSQLTVKQNEVLCSFIASTNATNSCRFHFKVVNIPDQGNGERNYDNDVFIIAQREMYCMTGRDGYFPATSRNNDFILANEIIKVRDNGRDEKSRTSYATMFFIILCFVFSLTFLFFISFIQNIPCGLCNRFRRPSSQYFTNVRVYPGPFSEFEHHNTLAHV